MNKELKKYFYFTTKFDKRRQQPNQNIVEKEFQCLILYKQE